MARRTLQLLCSLLGAHVIGSLAEMSNQKKCQIFAEQGPTFAKWCPEVMKLAANGAFLNTGALGDGLVDATFSRFEKATVDSVDKCIAQSGGDAVKDIKMKWETDEVYTKDGSNDKTVLVFEHAVEPRLSPWVIKCLFNDDNKLVKLEQYTTKKELDALSARGADVSPPEQSAEDLFELQPGEAKNLKTTSTSSVLPVVGAFASGLVVAALGFRVYTWSLKPPLGLEQQRHLGLEQLEPLSF